MPSAMSLLKTLFGMTDATSRTAAADTGAGDTETVRRIASELGFSHKEYVDSRARYSGYREVMKGLREPTG